MPIHATLQPKARTPNKMPNDVHRTPGKDECFRELEKIRRDSGLQGFEYSELAELTNWSRQHVVNTIKEYYTEVEEEFPELETETETVVSHGTQIDISIPPNVDSNSYLRGYLAGLLAEK